MTERVGKCMVCKQPVTESSEYVKYYDGSLLHRGCSLAENYD